MIRQPVSSSNLRSVGYDPETQTMGIEFKSGGVYRYDGVPPALHAGLMGASSHGSYFHENIKGQYGDRRVE
jgi:hypothetical protein